MKATIYNIETGKILRTVMADPDHIDLQCQVNEDFYLNCPSTATHIINNEPVTIVPEPLPLTPEQIIANISNAVQNHLDSVARSRMYDNILSLCSYVNTGDSTFDAEGNAGRIWRSAVWRYCHQLLTDVQNGIRTVPTTEELIAELPLMEWPT